MKCACEDQQTFFNSGYKGILARVEGGKIKSNVERCDTCETYASDKEAKQALLRFLKAGINPVLILTNRKDTQKQLKELDKYLSQNEGHLDRTRLKAFEGIHNLLTSISLKLKEEKSVPAKARKTH